MFFIVLTLLIVQIFHVQTRMILSTCENSSEEVTGTTITVQAVQDNKASREHIMAIRKIKDATEVNLEDDTSSYEAERKRLNDKISSKKPCSVVVLSNIQNPSMQSLIRKYRYDSKGLLIPSSVRYFFKVSQGVRMSPLLVPLNDKAFSPLGGFVRYYKEVPPIPQSW